MLIPIYTIHVHDADHQRVTMYNDNYEVSQPALYGFDFDFGPAVFANAEEGLEACIELQDQNPDFTFHLVSAGEVEINRHTQPDVFFEDEEFQREAFANSVKPVHTKGLVFDFAEPLLREADPEIERLLQEEERRYAIVQAFGQS